jgi:hypothetical protein
LNLKDGIETADSSHSLGYFGVPGWVSSSQFDIEAKIAAELVAAFKNAKSDERLAM